MDGWKTILSFREVLFSGTFAVSFRLSAMRDDRFAEAEIKALKFVAERFSDGERACCLDAQCL